MQPLSGIDDNNDALTRHQVQHVSRLSRLQQRQQPEQQQEGLVSGMQPGQRQSQVVQPKSKLELNGLAKKKPGRFEAGKQDLAVRRQASPKKRGVAAAKIWT